MMFIVFRESHSFHDIVKIQLDHRMLSICEDTLINEHFSILFAFTADSVSEMLFHRVIVYHLMVLLQFRSIFDFEHGNMRLLHWLFPINPTYIFNALNIHVIMSLHELYWKLLAIFDALKSCNWTIFCPYSAQNLLSFGCKIKFMQSTIVQFSRNIFDFCTFIIAQILIWIRRMLNVECYLTNACMPRRFSLIFHRTILHPNGNYRRRSQPHVGPHSLSDRSNKT